ncbi:zinc ribbon domain-containing protein [Microbacterium sp. CFH 31415]|uniref:Zn-ribbon domain-containing OB-fold protein n=1 Tax=Microbacterium sp. CFH 31415 TaxID=2921732 RepID=UPI001F14929A|nr:zinc ribbon domain-containing protein [Microbacterium sp. CFH 31415]MCH6231630.1 zinc ribbon domain-containing protein [Microbacterium sp. CFH 31415]
MTTSVPHLVRTQDNAFWFEAAAEGRLAVQRCSACETLRHPPAPACPECHSFEWDSVDAPLHGTLHSWTVVHHPKDGSLAYPLAVGLVDLETGTRLVADFEEGTDVDALRIDAPVDIVFGEHAHAEILPRLRLSGGRS